MLYDAFYERGRGQWYLLPCGYPLGTVASGPDCRGRAAGTYNGTDYGSRHNEGGNMVFCDGHGKWLKDGVWNLYPQSYASYWDERR
jgi:prepilin-type processing-associated H-X9-DG protein